MTNSLYVRLRPLTLVALLCAWLGSAVPTAVQESGTIALRPADTFLNLNARAHAHEQTLDVYTWPDRSPGKVALLKFDLSSLPSDAVITRATLRLALVASDPEAERTYRVTAHRVLSGPTVIARATGFTSDGSHAWTASGCCEAGVPMAQSNIAEPEAALDVDADQGFKELTITRMAQDWRADPSTNFGVLLNADTTASAHRYRAFASSEHPDPALRPYLEVTYSASDAQPPSVTLSPLASEVSETVELNASALDRSGVAAVQFYIDGEPYGEPVTSFPYVQPWDTTGYSDGTHHVVAAAMDGSGNLGVSTTAAVTIANGYAVVQPDDTTLKLDTANYGTLNQIRTYTWPDRKPANVGLLKFDLSGLPSGSVIEEATLHLALVESDAVNDTYTVSVHRITGKSPVPRAATGHLSNGSTRWTASSCCDGGVPLAQADIGSAVDRKAVDRTAGFHTWTVTNLVERWVRNPSSNFGLLVNSDSSKPKDRYRYFASMEHRDSKLRPYLRIKLGSEADTTPPVISGVSSSSITASSAVITWATQEPSDTQVEYGTSTSYGQSSPLNTSLVTSHSVPLGGLQASTTYYYRVKSRDRAGNLATSSGFSFRTAAPAGDTTPPSVSVTAPAAGARVSGTVTLSASASDDVGVVGVQFLVDGAAVGSEDTSSPYSASWSTSGIAPGTHVISAVARDAAGNRKTSAGVSVTVTTGDSPGTAVFQSNWSNGTGTSSTAITDGNRWDHYWEFNGGSSVRLLSVVAGGPAGLNALKVLQRGSAYAANLQVDDVVPVGTDYYVRYYMRNDDTSSAGDHVVTVDTYDYDNLTFVRKYGSSSGWRLHTSLYGCGFTYPIGHWGPSQRLANGQWYRFEYHVDYIDRRQVRVYPRVYDAAGTLILSAADFRQEDYGSARWNGRSDWTLASYYAAGHSFCVDPEKMNEFGLGNNGQQGAADTGLAWYFAGVEIRTDRWPGPASGGSGPEPEPEPKPTPDGSLSSRYPGDVGIEKDPAVLFVERFDATSVSTILANWTDVMNGSRMVSSTDIPPGSPGGRSIDIPWIGGVSTGGHLYRTLPATDGTVYVRYYIKYPAAGTYQHDGVWMGGYNPSISWPEPKAGTRPAGNDRFSASAEQSDDGRRFDHYNYWMDMRMSGDGRYWGNTLLNNPAVTLPAGQWACVEQMVKLNDPSSSNGEHAIWLNGVKVSHVGPGFPNGRWSGGNFIQDPSGSPFPGIRWRSTSELKVNWIWLQNYAPSQSSGSGSMKFDHVVVAKSYIGCLAK